MKQPSNYTKEPKYTFYRLNLGDIWWKTNTKTGRIDNIKKGDEKNVVIASM